MKNITELLHLHYKCVKTIDFYNYKYKIYISIKKIVEKKKLVKNTNNNYK